MTPVQFSNGDLRWDIRDIDGWIDSLKGDHGLEAPDAILAKLG